MRRGLQLVFMANDAIQNDAEQRMILLRNGCKRRKLLKSSADYTNRHGGPIYSLLRIAIGSILAVQNRMCHIFNGTNEQKYIEKQRKKKHG